MPKYLFEDMVRNKRLKQGAGKEIREEKKEPEAVIEQSELF